MIGVASRARDDLHGVDELPELLPDADAVVVLAPLTDATRGLIGTRELAPMRDGAVLINAARGPVVDTDALVAEVTTGRLRAVLDVTDPEPLPDDHPLWSAPGVLSITPHIAGDSPPATPGPPSWPANSWPAGAPARSCTTSCADDRRRPPADAHAPVAAPPVAVTRAVAAGGAL